MRWAACPERSFRALRRRARVAVHASSTEGSDMESRSLIATEQTRESPAFGKLATPDEAEVELAKEGVIGVAFQATWKPSVSNAARAALFVDGVQFSLAGLL